MDSAQAFKMLSRLSLDVALSDYCIEGCRKEADRLAIELSAFEMLLVGSVSELEAVGNLNFQGVLYVEKRVNRAAIEYYRRRHPNITVITNVVGYPRVLHT